MYEAFYNLSEKPFTLLPDPGFLYMSDKHRMAFSMLEYGLLNNAGFITGPDGVIVIDSTGTEARANAFRAAVDAHTDLHALARWLAVWRSRICGMCRRHGRWRGRHGWCRRRHGRHGWRWRHGRHRR